MVKGSDFLLGIRRIMKLHEAMLKEICEQYQLTLLEATVLSFLHNNPELDTAGDIVEVRMLSKGNVSQTIENLIHKSLLIRTPDTKDRRKIHLSITNAALPISQSINEMQESFMEELFYNFSTEEYQEYVTLSERFMTNTKSALTRRKNRETR